MEDGTRIAQSKHAGMEQVFAIGFNKFFDFLSVLFIVQVFDNGKSHGSAMASPQVGVRIEQALNPLQDVFDLLPGIPLPANG